jgi:hypothetical protein
MKKSIFKTIASLAIVAGLLFAVSCSKKDHSKPAAASHKVVFKAVASDGCNITQAVYGIDQNVTTKSSLSGTTWQSEEITAPAGSINANVVVGGEGKDASSTLKVQIYVDGELVKEGTSTGEVLNALANYMF